MNNVFWKFIREILDRIRKKGRPPWNGQELKMVLKILHFWEIFYQGRPPMLIKPLKKSSKFSIRKVTHHIKTLWVFHLGKSLIGIRLTWKQSSYLSLIDRSPITMRSMLKNFHVFSLTGRSPMTIRLLLKNLHLFSPTGRSLRTIRPLLKILCIFH